MEDDEGQPRNAGRLSGYTTSSCPQLSYRVPPRFFLFFLFLRFEALKNARAPSYSRQ